MYMFVFISQNELRPAYEDFLLKKQEKKAKNKKKEEVNCTIMYKTKVLVCIWPMNFHDFP